MMKPHEHGVEWPPKIAPTNVSALLDVNHYLALASFVILYYDYLLTLPREIEYLWPPRHRVTFASSLYFLNRYMAIFGHMPVAYEIFAASPSHQTCRSLQRFNEYYVAVSQLFAAVICLLRVSALYNSKSRRSVVIFLSTIIVATVTIACWATIVPHPHDRHIFLHHGAGGCNPLYKEKEARRMALAWSGVLVYDVAVFGLTVYKAMNVGWRRPQTLFGVMLRDGALYFVVLFFANLANAVTFLTAPPLLKGISGILLNVLSPILVSRLVLNLRHRALGGSARGRAGRLFDSG